MASGEEMNKYSGKQEEGMEHPQSQEEEEEEEEEERQH